MRTFLFISQSGESLGIAKRIQDYGDNSIFYINNPLFSNIGDGVVRKTDIAAPLFFNGMYDPHILKQLAKLSPDAVIFDSHFDGATQAKLELEKMGIPVYGESNISKSARLNPDYLIKVIKMNGIRTEGLPDYTTPITYTAILNRGKLASSSLFLEYTRLMNDNVGPEANMGCVGYHGDIGYLDSKLSNLFKSILASSFSGKIDIMLRVNNDGIWFDGIAFYFNPNNMYAFFENLSINTADFFYGCSVGSDIRISFKSKWSCQVSCGVPPFPYPVSYYSENEISGIDSNKSKHAWLSNVKKSEGKLLSMPLSGNLFTISSRGDYVREARRRAYRTLANINVPNLIYRTDIGQDAIDTFRKLIDYGLLNVKESDLMETFSRKSYIAV